MSNNNSGKVELDIIAHNLASSYMEAYRKGSPNLDAMSEIQEQIIATNISRLEAYISSKVNQEVIKELESLKDNSVLYPVDPEWERAVPEKMFVDRIRTLKEKK